jgi:hypothetical protein
MSIAYDLAIFSIASGAFPVIAAMSNYRQLDSTLKIVATYFLLSFLSDIGQLISQEMGVVNNHPIFHIYIIISVLFLGAMYYMAFFNQFLKKTIITLSVIALLMIIVNIIFNENIWDYPSVSNTVLSVMIIVFSLLYFYQLLNRQEFIHIEKQALFWINAGMLFYFALNVFLFMLFKQIIDAHQEAVYIVHNIINIIANILFTIGLLCKPQKT